jgi:hypothetical protein
MSKASFTSLDPSIIYPPMGITFWLSWMRHVSWREQPRYHRSTTFVRRISNSKRMNDRLALIADVPSLISLVGICVWIWFWTSMKIVRIGYRAPVVERWMASIYESMNHHCNVILRFRLISIGTFSDIVLRCFAIFLQIDDVTTR